MLKNLTKLGYLTGGDIIFITDERDENGDFTLPTYKEWGFYEISHEYDKAFRNLSLIYKGYMVDVSEGNADRIGRTIELLTYKGEEYGTLDLSNGDYAESVPLHLLKEIRLAIIDGLNKLLSKKRYYKRMIVEAKDPQTIRDIELKFDIEGMNTNA